MIDISEDEYSRSKQNEYVLAIAHKLITRLSDDHGY